jgi:hypothetical protein
VSPPSSSPRAPSRLPCPASGSTSRRSRRKPVGRVPGMSGASAAASPSRTTIPPRPTCGSSRRRRNREEAPSGATAREGNAGKPGARARGFGAPLAIFAARIGRRHSRDREVRKTPASTGGIRPSSDRPDRWSGLPSCDRPRGVWSPCSGAGDRPSPRARLISPDETPGPDGTPNRRRPHAGAFSCARCCPDGRCGGVVAQASSHPMRSLVLIRRRGGRPRSPPLALPNSSEPRAVPPAFTIPLGLTPHRRMGGAPDNPT